MLPLARQSFRRSLVPLAMLAFLLFITALAISGIATRAAEPSADTPRLTLQPNDHICIIGNTLADRMQHSGWLETYLHSRFPTYQLTVRNLGFSGDEIAGYTDKPDRNRRLRSMDFGTADQWLSGSAPVPQPGKLVTRHGVRDNRFETTNTRPDVIFAFFGYNESYAGAAGLDAFKKNVDAFVKHTLGQKYNGKSAPRLVLISPIAFEDHKDRNLPSGVEQNKNLELYTKAMQGVAKADKIPFVDLFHPTLGLYKSAKKPLTINGVHLNDNGNETVAQIIDWALFAHPPEAKRDPRALAKLHAAVLDKNDYWFHRYRVLDGYNVYGGRAFEKYADRQSNYEDQQRELEILDVMTTNRDHRIWAIAQGSDLDLDDSNTPPFIPVKTNKPGTGPNGTHIYLDGEEAITKMTVAPGMKVTLFASEKDFPELAKPVQMQFDPQGRLWVAAWPSYPHWKPKEERNDKILIFEDTKGTGKADKMTVFADHLHCPTGFEFYNGGVLVAQAPGIVFLKDTKGIGKADLRVRVLDGIDSADTHHTSNSFSLDPGGAVYFQEGTFHHTQVETPYGPTVRNINAGVYRYEPRAQKFGVYVAYNFANPHGHVWNRWGQDIVTDGTGANPYDGALFSGHLDFPLKHPHPPQVYQQRTRPCPGIEIISSRHFPAANQGHLLVANVIGFQGILQYKLADQGASYAGTEVEPILYSSDPNFRPSDIKIGPDGAIWFIDWQNTIIGHLQHAIRDPSRDRTHGRIYRITYPSRPLLKPVAIAGQPIDKLLDVLKQPEDRVRYRARVELSARPTEQVVAVANRWLAALDPKNPNYEHNVLEGLWLFQAHNVVNVPLLSKVLHFADFHARAAATRVLCYWHDRVPGALELLKQLAADPAPRVRLEAVRAASFLRVPEAIEVVLIAAEQPSDPYLDFVRTETVRALEPLVKAALNEGRRIAFTTDAGERYYLRTVSTEKLLQLKPSRAVYLELLFRKGVRDDNRKQALTGLADLEKKGELKVLVDAVRNQDARVGAQRTGTIGNTSTDESVAFDLIRLLTSHKDAEFGQVRGELEQMALSAKQPLTRQLGYVTLIAADGSPDKAWTLATKSISALQDLVNAMPLIRDPGLKATLYPKVESLLHGLPKDLAAILANNKALRGRYVRVEIPGRGKTLSLAEVEVYSDGRNIARRGRAMQKNTASGGDASRAIDGNTSGRYADGSITHTEEGTSNPWWEVDLGSEQAIERIVIFNRTDGNLGKRLKGYTLKILDNARKLVYQQEKQPAPADKASFAIGSGLPDRALRRAAMLALTSVRGQEEATFKVLVPFVGEEASRDSAVRALLRIPSTHWPAEQVKPLVDRLMAFIRKVPAKERAASDVLDAMQLADSLASRLPLTEARAVRQELGELGVRVLRLGTVPDQMLFDKEKLAVKAGKPVQIVFENIDLMPHNFVITQPGAMEEIGNLAEAQATDPAAAARQYVPASKKVLVKSHLLMPRGIEKIDFVAPTKPGVYPFVCTYPGHWRRMYGALYVVADLDQYLADPEAYLAKNPLPAQDELLKFVRPRKEWKYEELAASVEPMPAGRSYANGKQMFQIANCVACHKLNNVGTEIGPDLTKLDPKQQKPAEILHDIIEPSFRINEKFQSYVIELNSGKIVTGLILEETGDTVKVIENPLAKTAPLILKKADIAGRTKSPTSIMPKGLLDKLTREEILDLVAYIAAGGNPKHPVYQGNGHAHGGGH